jgi:hypothetical protein
MSIRSKRAPLLRDLEANRTAVRDPRRDSLDRLLCGRRRVKAEPETSKPSEPPERRVRAFCPRQTGLVLLRPSGPADCAGQVQACAAARHLCGEPALHGVSRVFGLPVRPHFLAPVQPSMKRPSRAGFCLAKIPATNIVRRAVKCFGSDRCVRNQPVENQRLNALIALIDDGTPKPSATQRN